MAGCHPGACWPCGLAKLNPGPDPDCNPGGGWLPSSLPLTPTLIPPQVGEGHAARVAALSEEVSNLQDAYSELSSMHAEQRRALERAEEEATCTGLQLTEERALLIQATPAPL